MEEVLAGGDDIVVRVYGDNLETAGAKADEVQELIAGVDGITDAHVVPVAMEPTLEVEVDLPAAEAEGIKPGEVPPSGGRTPVRHRGRKPVRGPEGLRGRRVGHPGAAAKTSTRSTT